MSATAFTTSTRRLPGSRFEAQSRPLGDSLPRMDVAVFVGFAASGPINRPVAIEDSAQFAEIFGEDAALAWDTERGQITRAYLGPTVRDFFRQGGRRCWIIRVARDAHYNYFPIPALLELRADGALTPAFASARSEGSWSDALRTGTRLQARPIEVIRASFTQHEFELSPPSPADVRPGDLLRFALRDEGYGLFCVVDSVRPSQDVTSPPDAESATVRGRRIARRRSLVVQCVKPVWFSTRPPASSDLVVLPLPSRVLIFNNQIEGHPIGISEQPTFERQEIKLTSPLSLAEAPTPGTVMRVDFADTQLWLTVRDIRSTNGATGRQVQITGRGFWRLANQPAFSPETTVEVERLSFDLFVRETGDKPLSLSDLGFHKQHARYWGAWSTDEMRYRRTAFATNTNTNRELFPLAPKHDDTDNDTVYLPLMMPLMADSFAGAIDQPESALERDGLTAFGSDLFLDPDMKQAGIEDLMSQADYLRYQSPAPRTLKGIHAALDIEEATIIAVPDALQRAWTFKPPEVTPPEPSAQEHPAWENFLDCGLRDLVPPHLTSEGQTPGGTISLRWSTVRVATRYVVEESRNSSWSGAAVVYTGPPTQLTLYGRSEGDYFYRVRAETKTAVSNWSGGIRVSASSRKQWQVETAESYRANSLLDVHRALLRMCVARGDLFAVLALPEHYREDDAITHADLLRPAKKKLPTDLPPLSLSVAPLSFGEERATSYAAVYHPWLITRRDEILEPWQIVPPDGTACGVMAQRAITRGAWSAPANELLRGVISLTPPLTAGRRLDLQEAQINIFRREPRGFVSLGADTLSREIDVRPINVRRLLILLRRLALRVGATYVFEPNDDSFRRLVQRGFETVLEGMFERGAFAGNTPATSFQVIADDSINTPTSVDQGRFIVELRVAPSLPLTFITIRLVQANDRSLVMEVR